MIVAAAVLIAISLGMLMASAILALVRLAVGPTALDRAIAIDVVTAAVIGTVVVLIGWWSRTELMVLLIVFALTAFFSTVTVARFQGDAAKRQGAGGLRRSPANPAVQPTAEAGPRPSAPEKGAGGAGGAS